MKTTNFTPLVCKFIDGKILKYSRAKKPFFARALKGRFPKQNSLLFPPSFVLKNSPFAINFPHDIDALEDI